MVKKKKSPTIDKQKPPYTNQPPPPKPQPNRKINKQKKKEKTQTKKAPYHKKPVA